LIDFEANAGLVDVPGRPGSAVELYRDGDVVARDPPALWADEAQ